MKYLAAPNALDELPSEVEVPLNCAPIYIPSSDILIADTKRAMVPQAAVGIGIFNLEKRPRRFLDVPAVPRNISLTILTKLGAFSRSSK